MYYRCNIAEAKGEYFTIGAMVNSVIPMNDPYDPEGQTSKLDQTSKQKSLHSRGPSPFSKTRNPVPLYHLSKNRRTTQRQRDKMKGTSKVIMGATLVMVVSLAVVLGLILVLLAELYCSLLLRRRRELRTAAAAAVPTAVTTRTNASPSSHTSYSQQHSPPPPPPPPPPLPFTSIYAHGVLQAPRNFLFPAVSSKVDVAEAKRQLSELHQVIQMQTLTTSPPKPIQEGQEQDSLHGSSCPSSCGEHLVYISNPIYENDESKASGENTPFETPHTSPSHLERSGSSGEDEVAQVSPSNTPPLTPMKKLPAEACSVPLRDARSLGTSGSESRSNNGLSSSSSGTPCTSPSW